MGEPATPTAKERAETRELAAKIVEAVRNDEVIPLPIDPWNLAEMRPSTRREFEALVFQLAQEIELLRAEINELADLADEANGDPSSCSYIVPVGERVAEIRKLTRG